MGNESVDQATKAMSFVSTCLWTAGLVMLLVFVGIGAVTDNGEGGLRQASPVLFFGFLPAAYVFSLHLCNFASMAAATYAKRSNGFRRLSEFRKLWRFIRLTPYIALPMSLAIATAFIFTIF
jgi:hypothetical protein